MARNTDKSKPNTKGKRGANSSPEIRKEARLWGMAAIGILLLVAVLIPDRVGFVGRFINGTLLGLFGIGGVALPIALICLAVLELISKEVRIPLVRSAIVAWLVLAWLHNIVSPVDGYYTGIDYLRAVFNGGRLLGGGVMGAVLGSLFRIALGSFLSILAISVLIIVMLMFITGRSFVNLIGRGVDKARDMYDERASGQYEDEDFDDTDDKEHVPKRVKKVARKKNSTELKPLSRRRKKDEEEDQRADLIHIDPTESYDDDNYTVLLVQEELKNVPEQGPRETPQFLRTGRRRISANPKILTFGDEAEQPVEETSAEEPKAYLHDDDVHTASSGASSYLPITGIPPQAENELNEARYEYDDNTPLVVRGMVDGADSADPPPLFAYDETKDPVEYDEYASISRRGVPPVPAIRPSETPLY